MNRPNIDVMRLFEKKQADPSNDAVAKKIAGHIIAKQTQLANYLNEKAGRYSRKTIAYMLAGFCIALAAYCAYLLINAIIN